MIEHPSPNHAERPDGVPVDHLVLHYTELGLGESLAILTDGARPHRVSSHYVLAEDGTVYRLVAEDRVAWHAGRSHWRGNESLNRRSVGIEIVNLHGDRHDYPATQITALVGLCQGIIARHGIEPRNVVGHSDIAPKRKVDPGLRFPWSTLAAAGIGLWPRLPPITLDDNETTAMPEMLGLLVRFGYPPPHSYPDAAGDPAQVTAADIVATFQRRFRPWQVDGRADADTMARLRDLLAQVGPVMPR
jgi:N-acetylmuramoyl-L-alanine amidase